MTQAAPLLRGEITSTYYIWPERKENFTDAVKMSVLCSPGEQDDLYQGTRDNIEALRGKFSAAEQVESSGPGPHHAIEWPPTGAG